MRIKKTPDKEKIIALILMLGIMIGIIPIYFIQFEWQTELDSVRVMTWNIHKGKGIDNKYDIRRIISVIDANRPDIIGLQEIEEDIAADIAEKLNMEYFFGADFDEEEGNAILSKYPIAEVENLYLSPDDERALLKAKISVHSETWNVYITHLSLRNRENNFVQIEYILNRMINPYSKRILLMGDFNFGPESEQYRTILNNENLKLKDTYSYLNEDSGFTFRTNFLFRRIDYIFCSLDLKPVNSEVIYNYASDHCALMTTFEN